MSSTDVNISPPSSKILKGWSQHLNVKQIIDFEHITSRLSHMQCASIAGAELAVWHDGLFVGPG